MHPKHAQQKNAETGKGDPRKAIQAKDQPEQYGLALAVEGDTPDTRLPTQEGAPYQGQSQQAETRAGQRDESNNE